MLRTECGESYILRCLFEEVQSTSRDDNVCSSCCCKCFDHRNSNSRPCPSDEDDLPGDREFGTLRVSDRSGFMVVIIGRFREFHFELWEVGYVMCEVKVS
jgi:hypothetical protein